MDKMGVTFLLKDRRHMQLVTCHHVSMDLHTTHFLWPL